MQGYLYSVFSAFAILIHLIINYDMLRGRGEVSTRASRYRGFLFGTLSYYIFDAAWGIIAGLGWLALLYIDTIFFFLSLVAFVLMWCRFVIAYLELGKWPKLILTLFGFGIQAFNLAALALNPFNKCFFYIDSKGVYRTGEMRDPAFYLLVAMCLLLAVFVFAKFLSSKDSTRRRSMMVFMCCLTMAAALLLQVFWVLTPFTSLGCLICNCFFHVFVIADEQTAMHMAELEKALERARVAEQASKEYFEAIEKQRQQEADLRKQLEEALQMAQDANDTKTAALTDLEGASEIARLASFHYEIYSHKRTGSSLIDELWPVDENGEAIPEEQWVHPEDLPVFKENINSLI